MPAKPIRTIPVLALLVVLGLGLVLGPPFPAAAAPDGSVEDIRWRGYESGLAESRAQHKPVAMFWYLTYCGTCKAMKRKVMPDARIIAALNRDFVPIRLDFDKNKELAARYGVEKIPTFMVLAPDGSVRAKRHGYTGRDTMVRFLGCAARSGPPDDACREVLFD